LPFPLRLEGGLPPFRCSIEAELESALASPSRAAAWVGDIRLRGRALNRLRQSADSGLGRHRMRGTRSCGAAWIWFRGIQGEPSIRRLGIGSVKRVSVGAVARSPALVGGAALLLVGVLCWPLIFSRAIFNGDWLAQLWFMSQQALAIRANHVPSLFLNYPDGVLYPHYAFYGGTLYALTGTLSLLLGNAPVETYVLAYLLGFAAAYGGWYWMARSAGLGRWWAHVPGLVFVTSSYYLTLIYARGDWPEFIGVSMIPLVVAAGLSVLRADRLRAWPALALTVSSIFLFGSHSLTIVWGSTMIALVGLAILLCVPRARRVLTRAGAIRVAGLVIPAALLSAWFLLPAAAYESNTLIATEFPHWEALLRGTMGLVSTGHLFTLSRASASTPGAAFALSLPILAMAWALASLAIFLRRGLRGTWIRVSLICSVLTALLIVLMTHAGLILALPRAYATLQFSYRLESYVLLALSGTVLAILVLAMSGGREALLLRWALLPVLAVSVVGAIQQTDAYPAGGNRYTLLANIYTPRAPGAGEVLTDYVDVHLRVLNDPNGRPPEVHFTPTAVHDNHVSEVVHLHPGQLVYTNLQGPPSLVHVAGAKIVGINRAGYDVLEIGPATGAAQGTANRGATTPTETVSLSPIDSLPVVAGRVLTLAAVAILLTQFLALAVRRRRAGRSELTARA
jgi:hypothetical protein